ncbi:MAG TPA: hypothetical protein VM285_07225 [Polyangia bacterium]|nr:hypothetical protein [Polyangia bacterium]
MDRKRLALIGIAGLLLAACGSEKTGGTEPAPTPGAEVTTPTTLDTDAAKADPAPAEPAAGTRRVTGTAVVAADGGTVPEGRIEITIGQADGRASGSLDLDGRTIALDGVFDGEHLRLWAEAGAGDPLAVRRGFVLGRPGADGALAGDFALSDSGGAWSVRGTWKSAD